MWSLSQTTHRPLLRFYILITTSILLKPHAAAPFGGRGSSGDSGCRRPTGRGAFFYAAAESRGAQSFRALSGRPAATAAGLPPFPLLSRARPSLPSGIPAFYVIRVNLKAVSPTASALLSATALGLRTSCHCGGAPFSVGSCPRCRAIPSFVGSCLSALPCVLYVWWLPTSALMGRAAIRGVAAGPPPRCSVVGGPPPLLLHPPPYGRAPATAVGGKGERCPALWGGAFLSADALQPVRGLRGLWPPAGLWLCGVLRFGACLSPECRPFRPPLWLSAGPFAPRPAKPQARCVPPTSGRSPRSVWRAHASNSVNSKSRYKVYRAFLYRAIYDFVYDFKLTNAH